MYKKMYRGSYVLYRCKTNSLAKEKCSSHTIPYTKLYDTIYHKIKEYIQQYGNWDEIDRQIDITGTILEKRKHLEKEKKEIQEETKLKDRALKNCYLDKVSGTLSQEDFQIIHASIQEDKKDLQKKEQELQKQLTYIASDEEIQRRKQQTIDKYKNVSNLTYELIDSLIDYIEIGEKHPETGKQEIVIHWQF